MKKGRKSEDVNPELIARSDDLMQKEIKKCKYYFRSKDPRKKNILQQRINIVKERNKGLTAFIDKDYSCKTCGSKDGRSHPDTSYCFCCDTDNWNPVHEDVER
ncbi:hypothetical protein [Dysgonomonas termitidis]|uniref:Uncharacterized protein n=1 Tax=Dysgonomonas termitidis TaxID=1516126 RepID=A0ABV9KT00_9BACT